MNSFMSHRFGQIDIEETEYRDGNFAIQLYTRDGEPFTTLSINLPEYAHRLGPREFFAKAYSENEEIARDALTSGCFRDTGAIIETSFGRVPIWRCC